MCAINHLAVKMRFASLKIRMQSANVRQAIEVIQFQRLAVNWPMHVRTVPSHQFVKSHQLVMFVNVLKATLATQNQLDASQLASVRMAIWIARTALSV